MMKVFGEIDIYSSIQSLQDISTIRLDAIDVSVRVRTNLRRVAQLHQTLVRYVILGTL